MVVVGDNREIMRIYEIMSALIQELHTISNKCSFSTLSKRTASFRLIAIKSICLTNGNILQIVSLHCHASLVLLFVTKANVWRRPMMSVVYAR